MLSSMVSCMNVWSVKYVWMCDGVFGVHLWSYVQIYTWMMSNDINEYDDVGIHVWFR